MDDTTMDEFLHAEVPEAPILDVEAQFGHLEATKKERRIRREFFQGLFLCLCFLPALACVLTFLYFDLSFMGSIRFAVNYALNFVLTRLLKTASTGNLVYLITG